MGRKSTRIPLARRLFHAGGKKKEKETAPIRFIAELLVSVERKKKKRAVHLQFHLRGGKEKKRKGLRTKR